MSSPAPETETALESGRRLFAQECRFVAGAERVDALPPATLPEIAFAGRSNVGKSSLINALTGRRTLARISDNPGRTQQLNFFDLGGRLMLVDMPGYGFARVAKSRVAAWTELIEAFLRGRQPLRRTCLLVDARHGCKDGDRAMMAMLDGAAQSFQLILTKVDRVSDAGLAGILEQLGGELAIHPAAYPEIVATSAHSGIGVPTLRAMLAGLASPEPLR